MPYEILGVEMDTNITCCHCCVQGFTRLPHAANLRFSSQPYNYVERVSAISNFTSLIAHSRAVSQAQCLSAQAPHFAHTGQTYMWVPRSALCSIFG